MVVTAAMTLCASGATARAAWYSMYKVDTGTTCAAGRVCLTKLAVSSCGGSGNICARYNANGTSSDGASRLDTGSDSFAPVSGTVKANANRAYNNNSGTLRTSCMFRYVNWGGSYQSVYYGGWAILPYTGVGSMATIPLGWTCYDLVDPGPG